MLRERKVLCGQDSETIVPFDALGCHRLRRHLARVHPLLHRHFHDFVVVLHRLVPR